MSVAARANEDRAGLGIAMMLLAYLSMAFIDTSVKWLTLAGLAALQLSFMRYLGALAISLLDIGRGGFSRDRFATDHLGLVSLRALLLAAATVINFVALRYLPMTVTSAIMFSAPLLVCALSMPMLGERVGRWRWGAILLGFCGVLVVIRPLGAEFHPAMLLPLLNALCLAFYSILTRRLSGRVATQTMQFYAGLIGTALLLPGAILTWVTPATPLDWLLLVALGLWGWFGHELLTRAHGLAPSSTLMPYSYSFMIYLTISGYLVFGSVPDGFTLVGAGIIVISGLVIWARERRRAPPIVIKPRL
ncbi:DMT family transporter [Oceaniglobus trochenteri]|uniref:DMT family transporter n=1 Tax=Oceaniglobus trochenteri TaxID=2763260 RepID=UPI001CFF8BD1|nr:DMT family transporter [Oceaniglobus trochenteri]